MDLNQENTNGKIDEKSCGIVLFREQKKQTPGQTDRFYLILKYPGGHFDFPKGHCEADETEHQTASRECVEETGIADIRYIDGFREEIFYTYQKNHQPSHKQVIFFLARTDFSDVRISHEHLEFYWLPYDAAYNRLTFDNAKDLLKKAEKFLNK